MEPIDPLYLELAAKIRCEKSEFIPRIIARLANKQQARILLALPVKETDELAEKTGIPRETVDKEVQELYEKGLVFKRIKGGLRAFYSATELKDATPANPKFDAALGPEFFDLWDKWFNSKEAADWWYSMPEKPGQTRPLMRIIPQWRAIENIEGVLPCDDVRELLKAHEATLGINNCSCRRVSRKHAATGIPDELCFVVKTTADYCIDRGSGRKIDMTEALAIIDRVQKHRLLHISYNEKTVSRLLGMCGGYCIVFRWSPPGTIDNCAPSRFQAAVDPDHCRLSKDCIDACLFKAIEIQPDGKAHIDPERCMGCGNCALSCSQGAISMQLIRPPEFIPDHYVGIY
jgi:Pyruvate/2-oxoacid:ferredoxin oxidoreductase delta subunit/biotin operon repressor